jgi:hypothetical protein
MADKEVPVQLAIDERTGLCSIAFGVAAVRATKIVQIFFLLLEHLKFERDCTDVLLVNIEAHNIL